MKEKSIINDPDAAKERHFADDYLDESPKSAKALSMRARILDGSRGCLEKQYDQMSFAASDNAETDWT